MNKVILKGFLGADPEIKFFDNSSAVANASLATSEKWNDKFTGEVKEKTHWHKLKVWGKQGETFVECMSKGSEVLIEGSIEYDKYQASDGSARWSTSIKVHRFYFCGKKGDRQEAQQSDTDKYAPPPYDDNLPF